MKVSITKNRLAMGLSALALIAIWQLLSMMIGSAILLPSPLETIESTLQILTSPDFWWDVSSTIARGLSGFLISCIAGIICGFLAGFNKMAFYLFEPWMTVIRTTPVMSVVILAIIWFTPNIVPIFVTFLMLFPIIYGNVVAGIANTDPLLLQMARVFKVPTFRVVSGIYFPSVLPYLASGASTSMGMTWKVVIAAEILSMPNRAIGTDLMIAKTNLDTGKVFAWTLVAIVVSAVFEYSLHYIEQRLKS